MVPPDGGCAPRRLALAALALCAVRGAAPLLHPFLASFGAAAWRHGRDFGCARAHHHHPHPGRGESCPTDMGLRSLLRPWPTEAAPGPAHPGSCALSGSLGSSTPRRLRTHTLLVPWLAVHPDASSIPAYSGSCAPFRLLGLVGVLAASVPATRICATLQILARSGLRPPSHPPPPPIPPSRPPPCPACRFVACASSVAPIPVVVVQAYARLLHL